MAASAIRCPICRTVVPADVLGAVGGACPNCQQPLDAAARHALRVARTRRWADQAAVSRDRADALARPGAFQAVAKHLAADDEGQASAMGQRASREDLRIEKKGDRVD